ncbi:nuclear transport factor 2 family protein [Nocardioides sp. TRM66260-LWL]|uniref:nuclear transport factor 2 family protein n=1 Tax=Nocardioides sp. TRM66260-LWL TaxID=2874478 RepID=UPI001CC58B81|nr:nuclear transport factor 2 family protein [Nocardioides sp. TRM66260-LWL]MBZ5734080.1 nuclear transport factor 2 family protein [Nocardioides sp. TRM66260-LWL]
MTASSRLVDAYLRGLADGDVDAVVGLFAEDGIVHSPLYGPVPARLFYPRLFADTGSARLTLRSVMTGVGADGAATVAFWFHFDWRLPSGAAAPFDVVDVATLDADGRIRTLHIVYDTVDVRPAFEAETGKASWRAGADS